MLASAVDRRFAGMVLAVAVSYATVLLPLDAVGLSPLSGLRGVGLIGAPVAALLGWWLTPSVAGASWRVALAIGLGTGVLAAVLGVLDVAYLTMLQGLVTEAESGAPSVGLALFLAVLGLPYAVLIMPVTIPCGLAWAVAARAMFRDRFDAGSGSPGSIGVQHVVIVLLVVAVGAGLAPLARDG